MKLIYNFLFSIFALFYLPLFFMKGKNRGGLGSRLGRVDAAAVEKLRNRKVIWIHAVSVGEVSLAVRLLDHWRTLFPAVHFVLTTTTVAGHEVASKTKHPDDTLLIFPADFRFSVRRFIRSVHPDAVVMLETEIWPNLVWALSEKNIPVFILNGRISDRAIGKYRRIRFFLKPLLRHFAGIGAQDERMRRRFRELGADPEKVRVTGNLKFDWQPPKEVPADVLKAREELISAGGFWLLAASTHEGEEEILFDLYQKIRKTYPDFHLFLAPRHVDRLASIESLAARKGVPLKRVFSGAQNGYDEKTESVRILDRMGALAHFYAAADAVFVGGSLVPVGGHNPVEPAYYGKPVLFGKYMNNFLEMSGLFTESEAAFQVPDVSGLEERVIFWMRDREARCEAGENARRLVSDHRGALTRNTQFFCQSTGDLWK